MSGAADRTPVAGTVGAGKALPAAIAAAALLTGTDPALATTDTTFGGPLATALAVGAALVGSVLRFNAMQLMGAVDVAGWA